VLQCNWQHNGPPVDCAFQPWKSCSVGQCLPAWAHCKDSEINDVINDASDICQPIPQSANGCFGRLVTLCRLRLLSLPYTHHRRLATNPTHSLYHSSYNIALVFWLHFCARAQNNSISPSDKKSAITVSGEPAFQYTFTVYLTHHRAVPLKFCNGGGAQKLEGCQVVIRLDTISALDKRTDWQTDGNGKTISRCAY